MSREKRENPAFVEVGSMIKIDKNVQMPLDGRGGPKYPWTTMKVGDSFLAEGLKISSMSRQAVYNGRINSMKFSCRTQDGGVRVWRVA